jgi:soluble lytic murein transglycosylase-like protein
MANLEGGARYLREQLDRFGGDLEKALAAYNAGPGRVQRAGGVPPIRETQSYVTAVIGRLSDHARR